MLEILPDATEPTTEKVVRDRDGRVVGTTVTRRGTTYVELAPDAPRNIQAVLDADEESASIPDALVAEETSDEIRLRA